MAHQFFIDRRPHDGMTYEEYKDKTEKKLFEIEESENLPEGNDVFLKINTQRTKRIDKTYTVSLEMQKLLLEIDRPQIWMVLTEDWCGDSAQNLPYIAKMAAVNDKIDLRILERDENLDIMDEYLTNGTSRSIPKLVAFDEEGSELFQWGPRPVLAQTMVNEWKADGLTKDEFMKKLHLWYGQDRGKTIESEFEKAITKLLQAENPSA